MAIQTIIFIILAAVICACSVLAILTKRILRSATYLLFVLFATAGIYFLLNYSFLGAVQLLIYAGGITILYVFSILLTSSDGDKAEPLKSGKMIAGLISTLVGLALCWLQQQFDLVKLDSEGYLLSSVPVAVEWGWWLMLNGGFALAIFLLMSLPASVVATIKPDQIMRYE